MRGFLSSGGKMNVSFMPRGWKMRDSRNFSYGMPEMTSMIRPSVAMPVLL
jgi:hypothetical protein